MAQRLHGFGQWDFTEHNTKTLLKKNYSYDSKSEEFTGSFLGKYIYDDYDRKDISLSCGQQMISLGSRLPSQVQH